MVKLTDVCDIQYGYAFDSKCFTEDNSYMPLVRIRDIKRGFQRHSMLENIQKNI